MRVLPKGIAKDVSGGEKEQEGGPSYIPVMSHLSGVDAAAFVIPEADRQKVVHVLQAARLPPQTLPQIPSSGRAKVSRR